jgi:RNA polymerase sigma-70 factor (ECF subfamily)
MDYPSIQHAELVRICVETGQTRAWEEFIRRFNPLIARVVVRTARRWGEFSRSVLDDLVQESYLKLCSDNYKLLRTFESRQPEAIYGYLKVVTANVVHDHFRATHAAKRGAGEVNEEIEVSGLNTTHSVQPSQSGQTSVERQILMQEIDRHLLRFVAKDNLQRSRLIFWLYYRSGFSASSIASIPNIGLTTKGVESTLLRLTRQVRTALAETTNERKGKELGSSPDQEGFMESESF